MQDHLPVYSAPKRFAEITNTSEREVYRWIDKGLISSFKIGRRRMIETQKSLDALRQHGSAASHG